MKKIALVTGASRGIGRGIALELAREGWDVCVNYANSQQAAEEVDENGLNPEAAQHRKDAQGGTYQCPDLTPDGLFGGSGRLLLGGRCLGAALGRRTSCRTALGCSCLFRFCVTGRRRALSSPGGGAAGGILLGLRHSPSGSFHKPNHYI